MIRNILRTTMQRELKDCNIVYVTTNGNVEWYVKGLSHVFNHVFFHENEAHRWNAIYPVPTGVSKIPINTISEHIDFVVFDDLIRGYDEALGISRYLGAPMVYVDLASGEKNPVPAHFGVHLELNPEQLTEYEQRRQEMSQYKGLHYLGYPLDKVEDKPFTICIDNFCHDDLVKLILSKLPKNVRIIMTDSQEGGYNLEDSDIFINTWNYPTFKTLTYMLSNTVVFSFATEQNNEVIQNLSNGIIIEDWDELGTQVEMIQNNPNIADYIIKNANKEIESLVNDMPQNWERVVQQNLFRKG